MNPNPFTRFIPVGAFALLTFSAVAQTEVRDLWQWPFAADSIWNTPIGSQADYTPANIDVTNDEHSWEDPEYPVKVFSTDPQRNVYKVNDWENRTVPPDVPATYFPVMRVPNSFWPENAHPGYTPNNCAAFYQPDRISLIQLMPCDRRPLQTGENYWAQTSMPLFGWPWGTVENIYGQGEGGSHFGSHLSTLGGSIRIGELTNSKPIRHALKVILNGMRYYYPGVPCDPAIPVDSAHPRGWGYRWPATSADSGQTYGGTNRELALGTLLAIPPTATEASVGVTTTVGKKIFHALQDYGAYCVDNGPWNANTICLQKGVREEVLAKYGNDIRGYYSSLDRGPIVDDMIRLYKSLYIVKNSWPATKGGPGTRRVTTPVPAFGTTIVPGAIYRLTPKTASGRALDVTGAQTTNGAATISYDWTGSNNQLWKVVETDEANWYKLIPQHTPGSYGTAAKVLDVNGGSSADGAKVQIYTDLGTAASQRWQFLQSGSYYQLQPKCALGNRLTVTQTTNGAAVTSNTVTNADSQLWTLESL